MRINQSEKDDEAEPSDYSLKFLSPKLKNMKLLISFFMELDSEVKLCLFNKVGKKELANLRKEQRKGGILVEENKGRTINHL